MPHGSDTRARRGGRGRLALATLALATFAAACDAGSISSSVTAGDAGAVGAADTGGDTNDAMPVDVAPDAAPDGGGGAAACPPVAASVCPTPAPSYANDVLPLLNQRCNNCHDPKLVDGPWPLTDWPDVNVWAGAIAADLVGCTMPPADGGTTLPEPERQEILAWLVCGAPNN